MPVIPKVQKLQIPRIRLATAFPDVAAGNCCSAAGSVASILSPFKFMFSIDVDFLSTLLFGVFQRNPHLSIKPLWTENNTKELRRERKSAL